MRLSGNSPMLVQEILIAVSQVSQTAESNSALQDQEIWLPLVPANPGDVSCDHSCREF